MTMNGGGLLLETGGLLAAPKRVYHRAEVVGDVPVVSLDAGRVA